MSMQFHAARSTQNTAHAAHNALHVCSCSTTISSIIDDRTAARREAIRWLPRCTGELFDHGDVLVERHAPEAALCWLARVWYE
jgi:hypothetical protein